MSGTPVQTSNTRPQQLELDPNLLNLNDKERQFFRDQTGITDDKELDEHIIRVQADAWKVSAEEQSLDLLDG